MPPAKSNLLQKRLIATTSILICLLVWECLVLTGVISSLFLPAPHAILQRTWELFVAGELEPHLLASVERVSLGFAISVVIGAVFAILCYIVPFFEVAFSPIVESIRNIAPLALLPAFMLLFGIGFTSKVVIIAWVSWVPIFLNLLEGMKQVDPVLIKGARSLGTSPWQVATKVMLPSALPYLFVGVRLGIGSAFLVLVAAEMMGANTGLGYYILDTSQTFRILDMYAAILTIGALGMLINATLLAAARKIAPWNTWTD